MPDIVWHPVSEEPPRGLVPLFLSDHEKGVVVGSVAFFEDTGPRYIDFNFDFLYGVTHWADITYPPAPEVE